MSNLGTMRDRIKTDCQINGTTQDSVIDDAIRSALREHEQGTYWFLEKIDSITLLSGNDYIALPTDLAVPVSFRILYNSMYFGHGQGFDLISWDDLQAKRQNLTSGIPYHCAVYNGRLYIDALASQNYTIECTYFKKDAVLPSGDSDTSVWFDEGYDVIRTLALAMFKDESREYETAPQEWARSERYLQKLAERNSRYYGAL